MVFPDTTSTYELPSNKPRFYAVGSDRLLSFLLDLSICFPFIYFLLTPIVGEFYSLSFWNSQNENLPVFLSLALVSGGFLFGCYQFFCWLFVGATAGQHFLGLRIESIDGEAITPSQYLARSFGWWLSLVFLGFPFFESILNKKSLCLHDRISGSSVFSNQQKFRLPVGLYHHVVIRICFGLFVTSSCFLIGMTLFSDLENLKSRNSSLPQLSAACKDLSEAPEGVGFLDWATSQYLAGETSAKCLESLSAQVLWSDKTDKAQAYLAKSFLLSPDKRSEYLNKVCQSGEGSSACAVAKLELAFDSGSAEQIEEVLSTIDNTSSLTQSFAILNRRDQVKNKNLLQQSLAKVSKQSIAPSYVASQKVRQFWDEGAFERGRGALFSLIDLQEDKWKLEELAWLCKQERILDCESANIQSCELFNEEFKKGEAITQAHLEEAKVLDVSCQQKDPRLLSSWTKFLHSKEAKKFVLALSHLRLSGREGDLERIAHNSKSPYQRQALYEISKSSIDLTQAKKLMKLWMGMPERDWLWRKTGEGLVEQFARFRESEKLLLVVKDLGDTLPENIHQLAVVALFESGQREEAHSLLKTKLDTRSGTQRQPASSDTFKEVRASLIQEFAAQ